MPLPRSSEWDAPTTIKFNPTKHAAEYAATAPALSAILLKSELAVLAEQYEKKDAQAVENQIMFKKTASRANWAVLLTACFSTLLLILGPLQSLFKLPNSLGLMLFGAAGVISGALGAMWLYRVREGKLLDEWFTARASAEALRARYFEAVVSLQLPASNSAITPLLLQFEYFRRYQLDVQLAYYAKRAIDHRHDADSMLRLSSLAVALAAIGAGLAAVLGGFNSIWVSIAALGTIATAISSFATTKESLNQSRGNADRYSNTSDALSLMKAKLDGVRSAAAAGQPEPVQQFVAAVNEQISAEHRQWLSLSQSIQPAIDKLESTLSELKSKSDPSLSSSAKV